MLVVTPEIVHCLNALQDWSTLCHMAFVYRFCSLLLPLLLLSFITKAEARTNNVLYASCIGHGPSASGEHVLWLG